MSKFKKAFRTNTSTSQSISVSPGPNGTTEVTVPVIEKEIELEVPESHKAIADNTFFGLENFGNTCYCNSVLQALYHCVPFRQLIDSYPNPTPPTIPNGPTVSEIAQTFKEIEANGGKLPGYDYPEPVSEGIEAGTTPTGLADTPNKGRWSMGMGGKKSSSLNVPLATSPAAKGNLTRLQTGGVATDSSAATSAPAIPANRPNPARQASYNALSTPVAPRDPNLPLPSLLSAVQSLFQYIESSPPHPPPPPKPPQQKPPGAETTGGTTLFNPHNPDRPFVRGGGAHGAGTMGKGVVRPEELVRTVKRENELFRGNMHQDAHEFLGWLLNKIAEDVEELEKSMGKSEREEREERLGGLKRFGLGINDSGEAKTFVHKLFEGLLTNETRCLTCETSSSRDESFLDLSIDIEQNSSVTACLRQFSASEMLCQKNKFFCDTCGGLQEAEKRMKIKRLPNILALHLKRFKYQEQVGRFVKLAYRVTFPMQLRLFNTSDDVTNPDRLYELYAIVVHIGMGPNQGHYVAVVKNEGRWLLYDDENVEPVDEADIPRYFGDYPAGAGYVLFYQAVDLDPVSLGLEKAPPVHVAEPESMVIPPSANMEVDPIEPLASPTFSTNIPMLDVEPVPVGVAAANMSAKAKVEAALADYQTSVRRQPSMSQSREQPRSIPPSRQPTSSMPPSRQGTTDERRTPSFRRDPSPSPSRENDSYPTSTLDYDRGIGSLSKSQNTGGNKWLSKFGVSKDGKNKRTSFYGNSDRPSSSGTNASGTSGAMSPSYTGGNGVPTRQRTTSNADLSGTSAGTSMFGMSPQAGTTVLPGNGTPSGVSRHTTPQAMPSSGNMSSSFMSSVTTSSSDGGSALHRPVQASPPSVPVQSIPIAQATSPSARPEMKSNFSNFAGLGRSSEKKEEDKRDRQTSGGSLTRRLSMKPGSLTRSSSAAFKSMLGGGKK